MSVGSLLQGKYRLERKVGSGGIGTVYQATDLHTGANVAVKILHSHLAEDADFVRRFHRGARIARKLEDPNIVRVLDHGQDGERQFLVMEFVEGKTLSDVLSSRGKRSDKEARSIVRQVAQALEAACRQGIVHRDIKPGNILVTKDGVAKVTDFDIARAIDATRMTRTGLFMGSVRYAAPEAFSGRADIRSDIYSLGIVLYEMLTGRVPFDADTPLAVMEMHRTAEPPGLAELDRLGEGTLAAVVQRCLEKRPEDRFEDPHKLLLALEGSAAEAAPLPQRFVGFGWPWEPSPRILTLLAGAAGLLTVLFVIGWAFNNAMGDDSGPGPIATTPTAAATETPEPQTTSTNGPSPTPAPETTATPANPPVAPAARSRIAFVSVARVGDPTDIYVMNADASGVLRLTENPAFDEEPDWSSDGSKIVFTSSRDGNWEIYVMNADGSGQTRLTSNPVHDCSPAWSPDGTKIAFVSDCYDGADEIYVMNADGSGLVRLTNDPADDFSPAWSPDGTRIAFGSMRDGNDNIYVMNAADGSGVVRLTGGPAGSSLPAWSPDGTKIAFMSSPDGNLEVSIMNADGSGVLRLTNDPAHDGSPAWSPDGTKIAFDSDRDGNNQIYLVNADGSGLMRLTTDGAFDPSWVLASQ